MFLLAQTLGFFGNLQPCYIRYILYNISFSNSHNLFLIAKAYVKSPRCSSEGFYCAQKYHKLTPTIPPVFLPVFAKAVDTRLPKALLSTTFVISVFQTK